MSDIKKFLDVINENSAGGTSSASIGIVAQPMTTERRINKDETDSTAPQVLEYGNWENSAISTSKKLKKARRKASKIVKSVYGEDMPEEKQHVSESVELRMTEESDSTDTNLDKRAQVVAAKLTTDKNLEKLRAMAHDSTVYRALDRYFAKHDTPKTIYNRVANIVFKKINEQGVAEGSNSSPFDQMANLKSKSNKELDELVRFWQRSLEKNPNHKVANDQLHIIKMIRAERIGRKGVAEGSDSNTQSYADAFKSETDTMKPGTTKYVGRKNDKEVHAKKDTHGNVKFYHRDGIKGPLKGVAEGSEQVFKVVAVSKSNALEKPTTLNVKASSLDEVFERLAINDWYPLEINGIEVIKGKRLKQGVAEGEDWSPGTKETINKDKIASLKNLIAKYKEKGNTSKVKELQAELKSLKNISEDLDQNDSEWILKAEKDNIKVYRSKDGGLYSVRKNEKEVAEGDYDRGAGGIWISHESFKGQRFFETSKEIAEYFSDFYKESKLDEADLIISPELFRGKDISLKRKFHDHEVAMARNDCYQAAKNAKQIVDMLQNVSEAHGIEGWVASKITLASDYLNTVREYLEGKKLDTVFSESENKK